MTLINKRTGKSTKYRLYQEEDLEFLNKTGKNVIRFNIDDLEKEYDYETDEE